MTRALSFAIAIIALGCESPAPSAPVEPNPAPAPTEQDTPRSIEMTFVGDVIFGRYRHPWFDPIDPERRYDYFGEVRPLLESDLLAINLETPVVEQLPRRSPLDNVENRFGADRAMVTRHLVPAGVDVASLANNHFLDLLEEGQRESPRILQELGITPIGASGEIPFSVVTVERVGYRIAFVAFTTRRNTSVDDLTLTPPYLELSDVVARVGPLVEAAAAEHDLVVVSAHWGRQYRDRPDPPRRQAAHQLVEAGADLVIGHHPHVLQGIERVGTGLVAHSLGNFLFEHIGPIPRLTGVLRVRFDETTRTAVTFTPAFIDPEPVQHPSPATGAVAEEVRSRVIDLSAELGTRWLRASDSEALELSD